jgi:hypothetical protein
VARSSRKLEETVSAARESVKDGWIESKCSKNKVCVYYRK